MAQRSRRLSRILPLALLVLLSGAVSVSAQGLKGVTVVRSDATQLVLTVTPDVETEQLKNGEILPRISYARIRNLNQTGAPMQLGLSIPVALPSADGSYLEVVSVEYGQPVYGKIAPVPQLTYDAEGFAVERYTADPAAYTAYTSSPIPATLNYLGIGRGIHSGEIVVNPYRYDPQANTIRFVTSIQVRLRYGGATAAGSGRQPVLDELNRTRFINTDQAANWALPRTATPFARPSAAAAARAWMRVEITEDGLYALNSNDFDKAGIDLGSANTIVIYGGTGLQLPERPESVADSNIMRKIPAIIERGGDNRITRILFYAKGAYGWEYGSSGEQDSLPRHKINPYVKANSYIVAVDGEDGRPFPIQGNVGSATITPTSVVSRVFFEEDIVNTIAIGNSGIGSGRDWVGLQMAVEPNQESKRVFTTELPGLDRNGEVMYRIRMAHDGRSKNNNSGNGTVRVEQNNTAIGQPFTIYSLGGEDKMSSAEERLYASTASLVPSDNRSLLGVAYSNKVSATGYMDWYEIHYKRKLTSHNDQIVFDAPLGEGVAEYRITGFSNSEIIGFDVTDPVNPIQLTASSTSGGTYVFRGGLTSTPKERRSYFITTRNSAKQVNEANKTIFADLRSKKQDADILVITHEDFRPVVEEYVAYRNGQGNYKAAFVTTDEIYTEYSNGTLDPTAIRDYIYNAYHNWSTPPTYIILWGDGSYDYRRIGTSQKQFVPTYSTDDGDDYDRVSSSAYDDYFVQVEGNNELIDIAIGRIPVENLDQSELVFNKIKDYERSKNYGAWRDRVILVADDNWPVGEGGGFVPQSDKLATDFMPNWMEPKKIYLPAYPTEQISARRKPGASQDLIEAINRGAIITNWVGHGNPSVWGHEAVFQRDLTIQRLQNDSMLTLVSAVTCNFGHFDNPSEISGGELFLLHPKGGAIGVLATTRAVYIYQNEQLMRLYFSQLFARDKETRQFLTLGQAMLNAKQQGSSLPSNDHKYLMFGDPSMRINLPQDSVHITKINSVDVGTTQVTVGALSVVTVEGVIRNRNGAIRDDFNGTAIVALYDADRAVHLASDDEATYDVTYSGGQLFRGPATVTNGRFTSTFRIPKDIAYDSSSARVHVYAYNNVEDAVGATRNIRIFGSDLAEVTDFEGPDLTIYLDDRTFRSGDVVTPTPVLLVDLSDTSGINSTGAGLGHKIEAWIDDEVVSIDMTETYQTSPTDYRVGTAERELLDMEPGEHKVRVRAWDIFNNPSEGTAFFRITAGDEADLEVVDVVNYPNPMENETDFIFRHNQSRPLDAEVDVFTASGRKVRELRQQNITARFVRIPWDGRDTDGDKVANGVYFYRLRVKFSGDDSGENQFETVERVAIVR